MTGEIDSAPNSAPLSREAFVRFTVVAGAYVGTVGAAPNLGAPHSPFVSETDTHITIEHVMLHHQGRTLGAYAAAPVAAPPGTPGVVVVQAVWGVDAQLRDVVRRFARAGYVAIAPDLYAGMNAPSGDGSETPRDARSRRARPLRDCASQQRVRPNS